MVSPTLRSITAPCLVIALTLATTPSFAAPAPATLTGTVYAADVATPLANATVVVTDSGGVKHTSLPTGTDGAFSVSAVAPGASALTLVTKDGSFAVATPVTLAPGATLGVRLALKADGDTPEEKKKKKGGAGWTGGAIGAMTAVLVGFAAAAVVNHNNANDDETPTSPSVPEEE
jgi:hypothetical protein